MIEPLHRRLFRLLAITLTVTFTCMSAWAVATSGVSCSWVTAAAIPIIPFVAFVESMRMRARGERKSADTALYLALISTWLLWDVATSLHEVAVGSVPW